MKHFLMLLNTATFLFCCFLSIQSTAQIRINEITPSNNGCFTDEYNSYPDWIEIYNAGTASVNLKGYGLSDNTSQPLKWTFPSVSLPAGGFLVVVADDTIKKAISHHWESAVKANSTWKYKIPTAGFDTNWRNLSYNDAGWASAIGGMGFGDSDDGTSITITSL